MVPGWGKDGGGRLRGSCPAPPHARARGARAPRRPAFLRRVTSALRSHYPDYPDYPAPADGSGTGTGARRHHPDAGHRFPRATASRTEPVPFLPALRKAKVEREGAVGGGSGSALELFRGSWEPGGMGV